MVLTGLREQGNHPPELFQNDGGSDVNEIPTKFLGKADRIGIFAFEEI